ncbi:MAG: hypothetical protein OEU26_33990, partial [Candidatus Tectomicrobia bacterium]|nr:hypothetical protein [Candidatus Tectomicrobia bacterium]
GYGGGVGGTIDSSSQSGNGPGGGRAIAGRHGGSAGHAAVGAGGGAAEAAYGNPFLLPLLGGSGGAGGGRASNNNGAGGGAGGGALLIASSVSITLNGAITANGGDGGDGNSAVNLAGGSGSGGGIRLMTPTISGTGTLSTQGGTAVRGDAGARGRIRIETFQNAFAGELNGSPSFSSSPGIVFLPADAPNVRVVSVAGVNVSNNPGGTAETPDATINEPTEVAIGLEAQFIPLGTIINLIISSDGTLQTVNSTPLEGTLDQSTATATATFPHGFSRIFVQASWTP